MDILPAKRRNFSEMDNEVESEVRYSYYPHPI